jgi:hypothetical protein
MPNIKAWAQLGVAILTAVYAALTDAVNGDNITDREWIVIASTGVGAFVVWIVPNLETGIAKYAKGFASFATAGLPVLYVVIPGGLTQAETIEVILAGLAAIGFVVGFGEKRYTFARKLPLAGQVVGDDQ